MWLDWSIWGGGKLTEGDKDREETACKYMKFCLGPCWDFRFHPKRNGETLKVLNSSNMLWLISDFCLLVTECCRGQARIKAAGDDPGKRWRQQWTRVLVMYWREALRWGLFWRLSFYDLLVDFIWSVREERESGQLQSFWTNSSKQLTRTKVRMTDCRGSFTVCEYVHIYFSGTGVLRNCFVHSQFELLVGYPCRILRRLSGCQFGI